MNVKMKKTTIGRWLALALVTMTLLGSMVGCASKAPAVGTPTVDVEYFVGLDTTDCALDAAQLKNVAQMLVATYAKVDEKYKSVEVLVGAYRGYDMLAANFDDKTVDPTKVREPNMDAVHKLLQAANLQAGADTQLLFDYSAINENDVKVVIESLQMTVDMDAKNGVWATVLGWIGVALGWITNTLGGGYYIIGICIFAILVEVVMLPFAIKQQKNSIKQAKLRPKEMAIRKKYAGRDDQATRQKVANEIQELYQRENFSPASGCLPLLVQMPIILALYNIVINPLQYVLGQAAGISNALNLYYTTARAAGGLGNAVAQGSRGTIEVLAGIGDKLAGIKDFMLLGNGSAVYEQVANSGAEKLKFTLGGLNLGEVPSLQKPSILWLVPVLTFVVYFFSMRLTKKFTYQPTNTTGGDDRQVACSNWMMDITMPLMSVWIAFVVPALVGIYWIFKSIISTLSRFILSRVMPYPTFTEEDYRAAEREFAGKAPKKQTPGQYSYSRDTKMVDGRPKSLFHMDDDDYVAKVEAQEKKDAEQSETKTADPRIDGAVLKDDDRAKKDK